MLNWKSMHDAIPAGGTGMIEQERGSTPKGVMLFFEKGKSFAVCILYTPSGIAPPTSLFRSCNRGAGGRNSHVTLPLTLLQERDARLGGTS